MSPKEQIPLFQEQKKRMIYTGERFPDSVLMQLPFLSKVIAFQTSCISIPAIVESDYSVLVPFSANRVGYERIDSAAPQGNTAERGDERTEQCSL